MECSVDLKVDDRSTAGTVDAGSVDFQRPIGTTVWPTASGRSIRHIVYSLIGCPPVKAGIYLLVHQAADGSRKILAIRATKSRFAGVNLARIRRSGARRGANEVHLFRGARTDDERNDLVSDLCRALRVRAPRRAKRKPAQRKPANSLPTPERVD